MKTTIKIEGMSCAHCQKAVENTLLNIEGIQKVEVDLKNKLAKIEATKFEEIKVKEALESQGYEVIS